MKKVSTAPEIDEKIKPLVEAMNKTGWITTIASCEGHLENQLKSEPYVAFLCKGEKGGDLCKVLKNTQKNLRKNRLPFDIVCDVFYQHIEFVQKNGWVPLGITFRLRKPIGEKAFSRAKERAFNFLVEAFQDFCRAV